MYLSVIFLPLISFFLCISLGHFFGEKGSFYCAISLMSLATFFALFINFEIIYFNSNCFIETIDWFNIGLLNLRWSFLFDGLTSTMLCVVLIVSTLVHLYSFEYMKGDPHLSRFISYLSLFTFFMLMLVTSANLLQLFLGWEGVGLCSYLLISFWFTRLQANKSALKAIIVNKIGDFALVVGISTCFLLFNSLDFSVIFLVIPFFTDLNFVFNFYIFTFELNYISFISLMFFIAAMGKSAQLFLHTWLPDAMEGPTPVSALIHAATMVTAGVFLIIRCSFIFEYSEFVLVIVLLFGGLTAFFAATSGLVQYDLKKVIAYSTCSQLGYMVFSCGLSSYNVAMFHLANHAFFKALLFLSAGSVIHALNNEQDMRRMGGLIRILPFSYVMFLIGSLALAGFPFLTGYYSKDVILEIAAVNYSVGGLFVYWLGVFSAFLTAFYSFRLIYLTFYATTNNFKKQMSEAHESSFYMTTPLIILGIGSIFIGFLNKDLIIGLGSISFSNSIYISFNHLKLIDSEFLPTSVKLIPFFFSCFGIFSALFLNYFYRRTIFYFKVHKLGNVVFTFLSKKWYFDSIYNSYISLSFLKLGYNVSYKLLDQGLIEYVGPTGISRAVPEIAKVVNKISTGYIYHYAFLMILGLLFFFFIIFVDFNFIILFFDLRLIILIFFLLWAIVF